MVEESAVEEQRSKQPSGDYWIDLFGLSKWSKSRPLKNKEANNQADKNYN